MPLGRGGAFRYAHRMSDADARFGKRPAGLADAAIAELAALREAIATAGAAAGPSWGAMHKALLKAKVDGRAILPIVGGRDLATLDALLAWLRGEEVASTESGDAGAGDGGASGGAYGRAAAGAPTAAAPEVPIEETRAAMRAFRKRLRLARLDAESRLGVGPLSGGKRHEIDAIVPPREFAIVVWEALVAEGRLRRAGGGFYALVDDDVTAT